MNKITELMQETLGDFYGPAVIIFKIILIIAIASFIVKIGTAVIKKVFNKQKGLKIKLSDKRVDTMCTISISVFKYTVYIAAILFVLVDIFNMTSVLAAAGVGGVAIGFGAQSFIKDTISGFFIILEDQYSVGDVITIDSMTGTVEDMELRVTRLKNANGDLCIIPNGEIKRVVNHTRDNKQVLVDIPIAYTANIEKVSEIAQSVCDKVKEEFDVLTDKPEFLGITSFAERSMNLRIVAKTKPNEQWAVERRIRMLIKQGFDDAGIQFYDRNNIIGNT